MMAYLLDANVFIQAKNFHYDFDVCPAFWDWLDQENAAGDVFSVEKVYDEIRDGGDELAEWTKQRPRLFLATDDTVKAGLSAVSDWATRASYDPAAYMEFLTIADYYLVAHAHAYDHVVVTHERSSNSRKKIKIPEACEGVGVQFTDPYKMLRAKRARFILDRSYQRTHLSRDIL